MAMFLEKNDCLGFVLPLHSLNNVPLFAEEVKFFPEESISATPIYF